MCKYYASKKAKILNQVVYLTLEKIENDLDGARERGKE